MSTRKLISATFEAGSFSPPPASMGLFGNNKEEQRKQDLEETKEEAKKL